MQTYYEILGVERRSTTSELKGAYRRRVAETHPDRADGRVDEFRAVCAAWDVLRDPVLRQEYDVRLDLQFRTATGSPSGSSSTAGEASSTAPPTGPRPEKAYEPVGEQVAPESGRAASGPVAVVRRVWRRASGRRVLIGTLVAVLAATGGLGVWWIGDSSRLLALAAGVYVGGVAVVLGLRWWGPWAPIGVYRWLLKACWGLTTLWILVGAGGWILHQNEVYVPVAIAATYVLFGISAMGLWQLAAWRFKPSPADEPAKQRRDDRQGRGGG